MHELLVILHKIILMKMSAAIRQNKHLFLKTFKHFSAFPYNEVTVS